MTPTPRSIPLVLALCGLYGAGCGAGGSAETGIDIVDAGVSTVADAAPVADATPPPDAPEAIPDPQAGFARHLVADDLPGPAFVAVADLDGDDKEELVVSSLGTFADNFSGSVTIYRRGADLATWTSTTLWADVKFPNQPTITDVDDDDDLDIVVPAGFFVCAFLGSPCGAVVWFEQTEAGWTQHDIITANDEFFHGVEVVDLDGDGKKDLVTVGETFAPMGGTAQLLLFPGTDSVARFDTTPKRLGAGLGSFPRVIDVDGDQDLDVVSAEFFHGGGASFAWFEQDDDDWTRHVIDDASGPSIQLTLVPNLYGDGKLRAVGTNHTNTQRDPADPWESAVLVFEIPEDPEEPWTKTTISTGIVSRPGDATSNRHDAPGIHGVGDIDGDGDMDIAVSGDGDPRVFWLEQTAPGQFTTHVLQQQLGQAGGMAITDLDGNGRREIVVTGYEDRVLYLYERD